MTSIAEQQSRVAPPARPLTFPEAVPRFLEYLQGYRSYSPSTVHAYRSDLRLCQEFLERELGELPRPCPRRSRPSPSA